MLNLVLGIIRIASMKWKSVWKTVTAKEYISQNLFRRLLYNGIPIVTSLTKHEVTPDSTLWQDC